MNLDQIFSFLLPVESTILAVLNLVTVLALAGVIYYSAKILLRMRLGRLGRGWKNVTEGLILLCAGFIFLTFEHTLARSSVLYFFLDSIGTLLSLSGIIFMLFGLRSYLLVWVNKPSTASRTISSRETNESLIDPRRTQAANNADLARGAIASFGTHCYAV